MIRNSHCQSVALILFAVVIFPTMAPACENGDHTFVLEFGNSWGSTENPFMGAPLEAVGRLTRTTPAQGAPIAFDMGADVEYTFHISGASLTSWDDESSQEVLTYGAGGTIRIYKQSPGDASRPPEANPPNNTVPSTFANGELILEGALGELILTHQPNPFPIGPARVGTVRGGVSFASGSSFTELPSISWTWNASITSDFAGSVPEGYGWLWGGQIVSECTDSEASPTGVDIAIAGRPAFEVGPVPARNGQELWLRFDLAERTDVDVALFSAAGRRIGELFAGSLREGVTTRGWTPNGAGVYFLRAALDGRTHVKKVVVVD